LSLAASVEANDDVVEGTLLCAPCSQTFPVQGGIPRFVDVDAYADTFSFEWKTFHDVQIDILNAIGESEKTFIGQTGWRAEDLKEKLVLDAGVGAGRFAEVASRWGAEVVGVDLSFAVDAARGNIGGRENVHIVQADLFRLPFRENTFDAMYSIGVLHHTPDTKQAFDALVPLLREKGEFAVFIYAYGHYHFFSDLWRKITTRIPHRVVYYLSSLAIPLYYLYKLPGVGLGFRFVFPMSQHPNPRWRWLDTFDWYTPRYQHKHTWPEVYHWFREKGFADIRLNQKTRDSSLLHVTMRGKKAIS
jgi:SAM-dependent methyltransferase